MPETPYLSPLLDDAGLAALRRTRPWMYFLGVVSSILAAFGLILLISGSIGLHINQIQSTYLLGAGAAAELISLPTAITQLRYAAALTGISTASGGMLSEAIESACLRQRHLWIVNAYTVVLVAALTLLDLIRTAANLG